jgi:hypothetical protein
LFQVGTQQIVRLSAIAGKSPLYSLQDGRRMIEIYQEGKLPGGLNQMSPHLGESNLFIAAGVQVVYGMGDPGDVTPDARPARRHQHEHADPPARQVLLVADVLVRGDKGVETFGLGAGEQLPVLEVVPAPLVCGLDGVVRQVILRGTGVP